VRRNTRVAPELRHRRGKAQGSFRAHGHDRAKAPAGQWDSEAGNGPQKSRRLLPQPGGFEGVVPDESLGHRVDARAADGRCPGLLLALLTVRKRYCRRCGTAIAADRKRGTLYCSGRCRRAASNARVSGGGAPDNEDTEAGRLEVQRRLATAVRVDGRCRCASPLGLVDEDGRATCFRCARPLELDQVGELPPAA
jgi:hypothetical protein